MSIQRCFKKVGNLKADTHSLMNVTKEDFKERIENIDKYYSESLEEMIQNIEAVRIMARDSVTVKEKELTKMIIKLVSKIPKFCW